MKTYSLAGVLSRAVMAVRQKLGHPYNTSYAALFRPEIDQIGVMLAMNSGDIIWSRYDAKGTTVELVGLSGTVHAHVSAKGSECAPYAVTIASDHLNGGNRERLTTLFPKMRLELAPAMDVDLGLISPCDA